MRLPARPDSARIARNSTEVLALGNGVDQERVSDLVLVVSELVANAVVATTNAEVAVRIGIVGRVFRVEVDDNGPGRPHYIESSEKGGLGLRLVDRISTRWGFDFNHSDKTVWAEVAI
jgi:anti-sigma regulatory factor (Ser/Thr protein kinase)